MIAQALQNFTGEIVKLPSFIEPAPKRRTSWVDPESKLNRQQVQNRKEWKLTPSRASSIEKARIARKQNVEAQQAAPDSQASVSELSRRYGVSRQTIQLRVKQGMTIEQALSIPVNKRMARK